MPSRPIFAFLLALFLAPVVVGVSSAASIVHHDVTVEIEPEQSSLAAVDIVTIDMPSGSTEPFHFLLNQALSLGSVRLGGGFLAFESRERWQPRDFYERPDYAELGGFDMVRQHTVTAPAAGWPDQAQLAITYQGVVVDSLRAPTVEYGRGAKETSGLIVPQGVYLASTSFWVPWSGEKHFSFRMETSLPSPWRSMSQGRRVSFVERSDRTIEVWEENSPMQEIYLIAGPYVVREKLYGDVMVYTYTYENTPADLCDKYIDATGGYLELYGRLLGPYPYAKFALVESWWQTGYGMPSFTFLGDRVIRLPFIVDTSYGHEILHNWWGNGVFVDTAHGNWSEGLTSYNADYLYKELKEPRQATGYRLNTLIGYLDFATTGARDFPLSEFRERDSFHTQAVGYGKTMMVFHMLRRKVGDDAFYGALRMFYERYRHETASWADLNTVFSESHGQKLDAWFDQWVARPGAAQLELVRDGGELHVRQQEPYFQVSVPVTYETPAGVQSMEVALEGERARIEVPEEASWVAVDPEYNVFRRLYREEIPPTFSQTLGADSTLVILGAECDDEARETLVQVAGQLARNQKMGLVAEQDYIESMRRGRALYLLGPGPMARRALEMAAVHGEQPAAIEHERVSRNLALCFVTRDPENPQLAWTVFLPGDMKHALAVGRKLPHYSKYSYLLFEGADNVDRGLWPIPNSPLRMELGAQP